MKPLLKSKTIALTLALLIISMPIAFAQQINYITDANGNLIGGDNYYREYNEYNQLVKIRQGNSSTDPLLQEYFWHPVEERILEKRTYLTNGNLKERILYISENYIVIENQSGRFNETYVYQDGVLVAQIDTNGNKQAMHSDHEGSSSLVTDSSGNLVEITFYSPFGEILEGGKASRFDYEGKEFDSAVQDYDFHFRKYNPSLPLFHQPDTLIQNVYDPQFLNRYMFERGNPQKHVDPTGHVLPAIAVIFLYGAATGLIAEGARQIYTGDFSASRLATHAITGGGIAVFAAAAITAFTIASPLLGEAAVFAYEAYGTYELANTFEGAQKLTSESCKNSASSYTCTNRGVQTPQAPQQPLISPIIKPQQSDQANIANPVLSNPTPTETSSSGGGYVPGKGYVTKNGKIYPTNNPNFVPTSEGGSGNKGSTCRSYGNASCGSSKNNNGNNNQNSNNNNKNKNKSG